VVPEFLMPSKENMRSRDWPDVRASATAKFGEERHFIADIRKKLRTRQNVFELLFPIGRRAKGAEIVTERLGASGANFLQESAAMRPKAIIVSGWRHIFLG
jgi:hypothetical protein